MWSLSSSGLLVGVVYYVVDEAVRRCGLLVNGVYWCLTLVRFGLIVVGLSYSSLTSSGCFDYQENCITEVSVL